MAVGTIPIIARQLRGSTLLVNSQEYIEAARSFGESSGKIIVTHVIPNCMAPIIVQAFSCIMGGVHHGHRRPVASSGLGVQPPTPEWGNILNTGLGQCVCDWSDPLARHRIPCPVHRRCRTLLQPAGRWPA